MKVLYIGVYAEPELIMKMNNNSTQSDQVSEAAIKYSHLISEGLKFNLGKRSRSLFLVPMGMFPVTKKVFWSRVKKNEDFYIPFINFLLLKQVFISVYLFFFIVLWAISNFRSSKVIIFNFIYLPFLIPTFLLKKILGLTVTSFVPDLPDYEYSYGAEKKGIKFFLVPTYIKIVKKLYGVFDCLFIITKYMKSYFPGTPSYVVEGFVSTETFSQEHKPQQKKEQVIMYAGTLFEKFGIKTLIDAFLAIDSDCELWIFGSGDMEAYLIDIASKNKKIKYFGSIANKEVLKYEREATLLVNPRPTVNEFTKFSFPSKLMEYMQSGTPVLTTKLPGIPDDYFDKMYYFESETAEGFRQSIEFCLSKPKEELICFGNLARKYVITDKSNNTQISKVLSFITTILKK